MDVDRPIGLPLEYIVNHVFLPPKLPQLDDTTVQVEVALTKLFYDALNSFIDLLPEDDQDDWITAMDPPSYCYADYYCKLRRPHTLQNVYDLLHGHCT